jgi:hypothetical protein
MAFLATSSSRNDPPELTLLVSLWMPVVLGTMEVSDEIFFDNSYQIYNSYTIHTEHTH